MSIRYIKNVESINGQFNFNTLISPQNMHGVYRNVNEQNSMKYYVYLIVLVNV